MKNKLFLTLTLISYTFTTHASVMEEFGKVCAVAGAALLGAGGAMAAINSMDNPTPFEGDVIEHKNDQPFFDSIDQLYRQTHIRYIFYYDVLANEYRIGVITPKEKRRIVNSTREYVLNKIANMGFEHKQAISYQINELDTDLKNMKKSAVMLEKRIRQIERAYLYSAQRQLLAQMKELRANMHLLIPQLELLHEYLFAHMDYFMLYENEVKLVIKYKKELEALERYSGYQSLIEQEIIHAARSYQYSHNTSQPLITYVMELENCLKELDQNLYHTSLKYKDRIHWARTLISNLDYIKQVVLADPQYSYEYYNR